MDYCCWYQSIHQTVSIARYIMTAFVCVYASVAHVGHIHLQQLGCYPKTEEYLILLFYKALTLRFFFPHIKRSKLHLSLLTSSSYMMKISCFYQSFNLSLYVILCTSTVAAGIIGLGMPKFFLFLCLFSTAFIGVFTLITADQQDGETRSWVQIMSVMDHC